MQAIFDIAGLGETALLAKASCALSSSLFGPTFRNKGSSDAGNSDQCLELIPQKDSHLVKVEPWLF
jgi:hypothetical protein